MMQNDVAALAGLICEAILYGIFTVLTIGTLYVLVKRRELRLNRPMVAISVVMFLLATAQLIVDCVFIFDTFIDLDRSRRIVQISNILLPMMAAKHAIFFTMMVIGDAIVIYRCFIVWDSFVIIILPIMLSVASAVLAYLCVWAMRNPIPGIFVLKSFWTYGIAVFALSLAANIFSVSCIAYRIWVTERMFKSSVASSISWYSSRRGLMPVVRIVIESGFLNAAYLATYMAVLYTGKGAGGIGVIAQMATPMIGIIFSLVIVRAGLNKNETSTLKTLQPFRFTSHTPAETGTKIHSTQTGDSGGTMERGSLHDWKRSDALP